MVKFTSTTDASTLFQFNNVDKVISNPESMLERADFFTTIKNRFALKGIVKRNTGLKNKQLHIKAVMAGTSKDTNAAALLAVLEDNEFFVLDTEGYSSRLDGTYAPNGTLQQKLDKKKMIWTIEFDIIEKED